MAVSPGYDETGKSYFVPLSDLSAMTHGICKRKTKVTGERTCKHS